MAEASGDRDSPGPLARAPTRRAILAGAGAGLAAAMAGFPSASRAREAHVLTFWQFYAPGGHNAAQKAWFEQLAKSWNDTHDIKVKLEYVPNNEYMEGTKLQTAFAANAGPDLFMVSAGDFLRYYNGGVLLDLTPFIDAAAQADFPDRVIASRKVDGRIHAIPMEVEPMAMFYSLSAFEEAGLTEKDVPQTWEELLAVGKRLTNHKRYGVLFETAPGYYQNFTWYPFMWQGGGELQGADGKGAFNSPASVQALKFWQDAIHQDISPRKPLGGGGWDVIANLASGYCAIQNVGIWAVSELNANARGFRYGVFRLPSPPGGSYASIGGGWAFVANAKGKNAEVAGQFCAWAIGSMAPDSIARVVDWCTRAKSDMPPRQSALEQGKATFDQGFLKIFSEDIYPATRSEPRVPQRAYKIVSDAIQACQLGGRDPATAVAAASRQLDAFLARYSGPPIV